MAIDLGIIRAAGDWMTRLRTETPVPCPPLTVADAVRTLGDPVHACTLWKTNWRTRIYRLDVGGQVPLIAKQMCVASGAQLEREFRHLQTLFRLPIAGLRMPTPVALLPEQRTYIMALARGRSLKELFWQRDGGDDLVRACAQAGSVLAQLHSAWTGNVERVPVEELAEDLQRTPGGFAAEEWDIVQQALEQVGQTPVGTGPLYLDFKASNIFHTGDAIALIDPPEVRWSGLLAWDVATFGRYLRWQWAKACVVRPWQARRLTLERSLNAFAHAYERTYRGAFPQATLPALLLRLLHLQQIGQLLALQTGKMRLVLRGHRAPFANRQLLREAAGAVASLPVLHGQKKECVRVLGRELACLRRRRRLVVSGSQAKSIRPAEVAPSEALRLAEQGAGIGGGAGAAAGVVAAVGVAVWRGLIPDAATTAAVGLMGVVTYALAAGFLGALLGGVLGWLIGAGREVRHYVQTSPQWPWSGRLALWSGLLTRPRGPTEGLPEATWTSTLVQNGSGDLRSAPVARSGDRATAQ